MSERLNAIRAEAQNLIALYNEKIAANASKAEADNIEKLLKEKEKAYADQARDELFHACKHGDDPIVTIIKCYAYGTLRHKIDHDKVSGRVTGMKAAEDGEKQINLVKFCEYCGQDTLWRYKVEKLGFLLTLRAAKDLKLPDTDVAKIHKMYRIDDIARKEDMGATPDSNNQLCKLLQKVIDAILYVDNGSGKNVYACNSHDVGYLLRAFSRKGKERLTIRVSDAKALHGLIVDVMHRIITGGKYGLEYKIAKKSHEEVVEGSNPAKNGAAKPKKAKPTKAAKEPTEVATEVVEVERELPAAEVSESKTIPA